MHSRLDRAGKANRWGFCFVAHEELTAIVKQELTRNNGCFRVGKVWCTECLPMRGTFSTLEADLHSVWGAYVERNAFHPLGRLEINLEDLPRWHTTFGCVTLC